MALIECPECKEQVSRSAENCPKCGCPIKKKPGVFRKFLGLCALMFLVCFVGLAMCSSLANKAKQDIAAKKAAERVTLAKFNQVQMGMSYDQVKAVFGKEGTPQGTNEIQGVPGFVPTVNTQAYNWEKDSGFGGAMCIFQNGKLTLKNQTALE